MSLVSQNPITDFNLLADALQAMAVASKTQSDAMLSLARSTAESVRISAGTYVFQLRDRFDELLPQVQVGASESSWEVEAFPDAFHQVVFHAGDTATANLRIALSQSTVRRLVRIEWSVVPDDCEADVIAMNAATLHHAPDGTVHLDEDVSLFIDAPLRVAVGGLHPGQFVRAGVLTLEVTDHRPEGATVHVDIEITLTALVVPDDDGIGLDLAIIECVVRPERRTYWLDRSEGLPLQLPKLG